MLIAGGDGQYGSIAMADIGLAHTIESPHGNTAISP